MCSFIIMDTHTHTVNYLDSIPHTVLTRTSILYHSAAKMVHNTCSSYPFMSYIYTFFKFAYIVYMSLRLTRFSLLQYDRIRKLNAELEEKLEASEIQIKGQSAEYRSLLQQKDVCAFVFTTKIFT